jgi:hypothetical protein
MIELDAISDLVKKRQTAYQGMKTLTTVGFDPSVLVDNLNTAILGLINVPAFKVSVSENLDFFYNPSSQKTKPMVTNGKFTYPFETFSIVSESDEAVQIDYIDKSFDALEVSNLMHLSDKDIISETVKVISFIRPKVGKRKGVWLLQMPLSLACTTNSELIPAYSGLSKNSDLSKLNAMFKHLTISDGAQTDIKLGVIKHLAHVSNIMRLFIAFINSSEKVSYKEKSNNPYTIPQVVKSKKPLWEYKLLSLKQIKKESSDFLGGTHASPRYHLRRGHWRTLSSGKEVYIDPMEVGDKSKGLIEKDYEFS